MSDGKKRDFGRVNSICPSPESELLEAVLKNDVATIRRKTAASPELLSTVYDHPYDKPILLIACSEDGVAANTVQCLIDCGARLDVRDEYGLQPLHLAAQGAHCKALQAVVRNLGPGQINSLCNGDNALHVLLKYGDSECEEALVECCETLLRAGVDVNQSDEKNCTPILIAARKSCRAAVKAILEGSVAHVDLDSHQWKGRTARALISEGRMYGPLPERIRTSRTDPYEHFVTLLKEGRQEEFVAQFGGFDGLANTNDGELLQISCEKGLEAAVACLVESGADVNLAPQTGEAKRPLQVAAEHGFYRIVDILMAQDHVEVRPATICFLLKALGGPKFDGIDHARCYDSILRKIRAHPTFDWNGRDDVGNTPLHYAVRYASKERTSELLSLGASLASKNRFGVMPIEDVEPALLECHLDACVKFDPAAKGLEKQEFEVTFDYRSLVPPRPRTSKLDAAVEDGQYGALTTPEGAGQLVEETETIAYMGQAAEFRHLLKHPVVVSFLFLKWHRIRWLFYANLALYCVFVLALVAHIFSGYCNTSGDKPWLVAGASHVLLGLTLVLLVLREVFQVAISVSYLKHFENYLEMALFLTTALILCANAPSEDTCKQLSSIAILLAAIELVLMLGKHPMLSTNVVMLKTVSQNFFKLLSWYSLLIVAFALSFNLLFSKPERAPFGQNETGQGVDDDDSFGGAGRSVFKTIVMLTGEFDAGSIDFQTYPIVSKFIFALFVFMITIILLNLLNGLAVSDTQLIKNEAELVGLVERAKHVHYVERMILGNVAPTPFFRFVSNLCCCCSWGNISYTLPKALARRISVFHNNFDYELTLFPNNWGRIETSKTSKKTLSGCCGTALCLDKETVKRVNVIVQNKTKLEKNGDLEGIRLREKISELYVRQNEICEKLDIILNQLTTQH